MGQGGRLSECGVEYRWRCADGGAQGAIHGEARGRTIAIVTLVLHHQLHRARARTHHFYALGIDQG
jgi:hypothetical protein